MNKTNLAKFFFTMLFGISIGVSQDGGADSSVTVHSDRIHLLAPDQNKSTALSYYNTSPESPDGNKIAYVQFDRNLNYLHLNGLPSLSGSLWVYDKLSEAHSKIVPIDLIMTHNGAFVQWVNDRRIAYMDGNEIIVIDIVTGEIVLGPFTGKIGHDSQNERILLVENPFMESGEKNIATWENGVYQIDVNTGERTLIIRTRELAPFKEQMGPDRDPVETWAIRHAQWSPNGEYVSMRVGIKESNQTEQEKILVSLKADGSDIRIFGPKPMHFLWYDNDTFFGHDNQIDDGQVNDNSLRRWDREARFVETLAGPGNHGAGAPNRRWFASENWYGSDPVILKLFEKGNTKPSRIVFQHSYPEQVWTVRNHVNPSFSRDSKRLYFNYAINDSTSQAAYYDLDE